MKVVQINMTLKSGSTGKIAYQIHQYLVDKGAESRIAFGYGDAHDPVGFSMYSYVGTHIHSFLSRKRCMQGRASVIATKKLIRFLSKERPDIVHLHNIHGHYLNYPILFRYLSSSGVQVVWTFHDCWPYTGKCAHYSAVGCEKWKTECHDCPNLATYPDSTFDGSRMNYRLKKEVFSSLEHLHIVCNSDWLKSQVQQSFLRHKDIRRIYNGVDTQVFFPKNQMKARMKWGFAPDDIVILGVSNVWKEEKGLSTFEQLATLLGSQYKLLMVGLNPDQVTKLPEKIRGIVRTENQEELSELYSLSDMLLNPSTEESFGMVPLEAMACGTPVIVSNQTACPEVVAKGQTGVVVDTRDIDQVVSAIHEIAGRGKSAYHQQCIDYAVTMFSKDSMCENYYNMYLQVLNEK